MALKVERVGTTTVIDAKPMLCHTCKKRKTGLFGVDVYMKPRCADCCRAVGRPVDG